MKWGAVSPTGDDDLTNPAYASVVDRLDDLEETRVKRSGDIVPGALTIAQMFSPQVQVQDPAGANGLVRLVPGASPATTGRIDLLIADGTVKASISATSTGPLTINTTAGFGAIVVGPFLRVRTAPTYGEAWLQSGSISGASGTVAFIDGSAVVRGTIGNLTDGTPILYIANNSLAGHSFRGGPIIADAGLRIPIAQLSIYADNTAAAAGGLVQGAVYRTAAGQLMVRF